MEQLYTYMLGSFGVHRYCATEVEGDKIAEEVNRRRATVGHEPLKVIKHPILPTTFESYFSEGPTATEARPT